MYDDDSYVFRVVTYLFYFLNLLFLSSINLYGISNLSTHALIPHFLFVNNRFSLASLKFVFFTQHNCLVFISDD